MAAHLKYLSSPVLPTLLLLLLAGIRAAAAISCAGCVDLDELNFDKTVVRFPYALVKFDIAFPYGEKHEAFAQFSRAAHLVTGELLVGTVGIKDYGELENKALGARFGVQEKQFPGIFLFRDGSLTDYVKFPAHLDVTLNNLKKFVTDNSALYIGRDGCLKEFNALVKNYANLADEAQLALIGQFEAQAAEFAEPSKQQNGQSYVTYMRKINAQGYDFVEAETKRLLRLKAGKVTEAKKTELQQKLNVLELFRVGRLTKVAPQQEEL